MIIEKFMKFILSIIVVFKTLFFKNRVFIFGAPIHGNLGDQAILIAENKFIKDNFPNKKIINVPSGTVRRYSALISRLINADDIIFVHGGGYLGNLWINEENMFRTVLKTFVNNKIIVFPQTVFFTNDSEGLDEMNISKEIYESHKNLVFFVREKFSYDFMRKNFEKCKVFLVPDIVLYLDRVESLNKDNNLILCLRNDKEKTDNYEFYFYDNLAKYHFDNIVKTDTIVKRNFYFQRSNIKYVYDKIKLFSTAKIVITDRLHGMILSYLACTPCIVFKSQSYKVKGVYSWLANNGSIVFLDNIDDFDKVMSKLLSASKNDTIDFSNEFNNIIEEFKKMD